MYEKIFSLRIFATVYHNILPFLYFVQVNRQTYGEGCASGERRAIVIGLGLVIEEVVNGGVEGEATPDVLLQHQSPDGVALVHIGAARLWLALSAPRERRVDGVVAREAVVVADAPCQGVRPGLVELREIDVARLVHPGIVQPE